MAEGRFVLEWTAQQKKLLALEHESEKMQLADKIVSLTAKDCEDAGLSLLSMSIESVTTALFGRSCLSLIRSNSREVLKSFKVGDEVVIYCPKLRHTAEFTEVECVVSKLLPTSLQVICDEIDESIFDNSIRVDARANDSTYRKYLNVLNSLECSVLPLTTLLFSKKEFQSISLGVVHETKEIIPKKMDFINQGLNKSQAKAVMSAFRKHKTAATISSECRTVPLLTILVSMSNLSRARNPAPKNSVKQSATAEEQLDDNQHKGFRRCVNKFVFLVFF